MKKLYVLGIILLMSSSLIAMKRKQPEMPTIEYSKPGLIGINYSQEEARDLYWLSVESFNGNFMSYYQYRMNMIMAASVLKGEVQHYYHNPLAIAVKARDPQFVSVLLVYGADPLAKDMSRKTALDMLDEKGGLNFSQKKITEEKDNLSRNSLRKVLEGVIRFNTISKDYKPNFFAEKFAKINVIIK